MAHKVRRSTHAVDAANPFAEDVQRGPYRRASASNRLQRLAREQHAAVLCDNAATAQRTLQLVQGSTRSMCAVMFAGLGGEEYEGFACTDPACKFQSSNVAEIILHLRASPPAAADLPCAMDLVRTSAKTSKTAAKDKKPSVLLTQPLRTNDGTKWVMRPEAADELVAMLQAQIKAFASETTFATDGDDYGALPVVAEPQDAARLIVAAELSVVWGSGRCVRAAYFVEDASMLPWECVTKPAASWVRHLIEHTTAGLGGRVTIDITELELLHGKTPSIVYTV